MARSERDAPGALGRRISVTLIALSLLLAAMTLGALGVTRQSARAIEEIQDESMRATGERLSAALSRQGLLWVLDAVVDTETGTLRGEQIEFYESVPAWNQLREVLGKLEQDELITSAAILSPAGEWIISGGSVLPGAATGQPAEAGSVARAREGQTISTRPNQDERFKQVFVPLRTTGTDGSERHIAGILRLESRRPYVNAAQVQVRRSLVGFAAGAVLIIVLGYSLLRLLRAASEAERRAAQADRMRALGTLTAGIAHELRNPLGILRLQIEDLRASTPGAPTVAGIADELEGEVRRLEELTNRFLDFARPRADEAGATCDVAAEVGDTLRLYRKGLDPALRTLEEHLPPNPAHARIGGAAIRQVLLNLLRNAEEAFGDAAGTITVTVERTDRSVSLRVEDTGPGMSPEVAAQIFDPFFTTRAQGTGLGLALCRNLAESAGGSLSVETAPGAGARFTLEIPLA